MAKVIVGKNRIDGRTTRRPLLRPCPCDWRQHPTPFPQRHDFNGRFPILWTRWHWCRTQIPP